MNATISGGDASRFSFSISSATLRSGETLHLPKDGVTVVVGPNNAGKSTFLRELATHVKYGSLTTQRMDRQKSVSSVQLHSSGSVADVFAWFHQHAKEYQPNPGDKYFQAPGANVSQVKLQRIFSDPDLSTGTHEASDLICFFCDAWQRIGFIQQQEKRDRHSTPAGHPLHILQDRPDLFRELDTISQQVFGQELTLDSIGKDLILRVGKSRLRALK